CFAGAGINSRTGTKPEQRARDIAAEKVGVSSKTAERLVEVKHAVEKAKASGDTERAQKLEATAAKSVAKAHKMATAAPPSTGGESIIRDKLGREVPLHLREKHDLSAVLVSLGTKVSQIKK